MYKIIQSSIFITVILFLLSCANTDASIDISNDVDSSVTEVDIVIVDIAIEIDTLSAYSYSIDELLGRVDVKSDTSFIIIDKKYTSKSKIYLRKEAYYAYCKMYEAALKENLKLNIVSAFRSNYHQQLIWESKWDGRRKVDGQRLNETISNEAERAKVILQYSSMPGSSRHHWRTDIDIYSLENYTFDSGYGLKMYNWLLDNAASFGFCQVYTANRSVGYNEEKWHWSYLPIAKQMLHQYKTKVSLADIKGFKGANTASENRIIKDYVFGINKECL